ncbi:MAG: hypothetical protein HYZ28_18460 [Myxococcales bacterium]|nr:hypothetical protein [Myxococcales bacterium]
MTLGWRTSHAWRAAFFVAVAAGRAYAMDEPPAAGAPSPEIKAAELPAAPESSAAPASASAAVEQPLSTEPGAPPAREPLKVALLKLEGNAAAAPLLEGIGSVIASRLAESPDLRVISHSDIATAVSLERHREMLGKGCGSAECAGEISGALGARYVVSGRLDRFGKKYMLSVTLFDSRRSEALAKRSADAVDEEQLPAAAEEISTELLAALEARQPLHGSSKARDGLTLGLKFGNQFLFELIGLNPAGKLELGWRFDTEWISFLQVGFSVVHAEDAGTVRRLTVLPSALGVCKLYRTGHTFQPYWGLALGLQFAIGQYGFVSETQSFPTVIGMFGFQLMFTERFGALMEASTNLAQAVLGLRRNAEVADGLNFDLSLGLTYRF